MNNYPAVPVMTNEVLSQHFKKRDRSLNVACKPKVGLLSLELRQISNVF